MARGRTSLSGDLAVEDAPPPGEGGDLAPGMVDQQYVTTLTASGGNGNYRWELTDPSAMPPWLKLDGTTGTIFGKPGPGAEGTSSIAIQVTDTFGATAKRTFSLTINPVQRPRQLWGHLTFWLAVFALLVPTLGAIAITIYALSTPGPHWNYLAVGMLTATAAFLAGCLTGFVVGIPRAVSSGQTRHDSSSEYLPSSNLAESSDWLTKLLLGAGLVQLTHLGAPIASLIDHVAAGLHTTAAFSGAAQVAAAAIIFGYAAIGLLDGTVVTALWYQKKLARLNP
jgi:Putative Ig domain